MSNTNTPEKPVVVFISNDHDTVIGVMVIKNDDENLQNNLEIIEKNWVAARNELLQRAREDDSIEADEDELHIAFMHTSWGCSTSPMRLSTSPAFTPSPMGMWTASKLVLAADTQRRRPYSGGCAAFR